MLRLEWLVPVFRVCTLLMSMATLGVARFSRVVPLISRRLVGVVRFPLRQPWKLLKAGLSIVNVLMLATLVAVLA